MHYALSLLLLFIAQQESPEDVLRSLCGLCARAMASSQRAISESNIDAEFSETAESVRTFTVEEQLRLTSILGLSVSPEDFSVMDARSLVALFIASGSMASQFGNEVFYGETIIHNDTAYVHCVDIASTPFEVETVLLIRESGSWKLLMEL